MAWPDRSAAGLWQPYRQVQYEWGYFGLNLISIENTFISTKPMSLTCLREKLNISNVISISDLHVHAHNSFRRINDVRI